MVEIRGKDNIHQETNTNSSIVSGTIDDDHHDHAVLVDDQQEKENMMILQPSSASIDWKGRPCNPNNHGGIKAAIFVLGLQAFEMMGIAGVGNNLITYVFNDMHFSLSTSANIVTNFVGTVFLLSLLGGFLSDSYLGSFWTIFIFGFVELFGFILLAIQAHVDELKPAACKNMVNQDSNSYCEEAKGYKAVMFFTALYLVALGSGCLKPNIISHGAHQFRNVDMNDNINNHHTKYERHKMLSSYFNAAYFAFCAGELLALTLLVWLQTHSGMDVGFGVSAAAMAVGLLFLVSGFSLYNCNPPRGSIFTPIAQVFVAAFSKRKQICPSNAQLILIRESQSSNVQNHLFATSTTNSSHTELPHMDKFRFLNKACIKVEGRSNESRWRVCSVGQVEQVKIILCVIPIFACTIIFNTILAQLQTFSVQQGSLMNNHITNSFQIPPASLQAIPYFLLIFLVPLYELVIVPAARKHTGRHSGISPLQRIGIGLFISTFSMVCAALVEAKRRRQRHMQIMSILWIAPQFLIFGLSEMFTAVGLIEFFYTQSLEGMQSFLTAMTYCSYSFGFYLSSLLVSLVNKVTNSTSSKLGKLSAGWLGYNDLNQDRLDLFYWLLAALSLLNFFNYIFWSNWYSSYNSPINNYNNENVSSTTVTSTTHPPAEPSANATATATCGGCGQGQGQGQVFQIHDKQVA